MSEIAIRTENLGKLYRTGQILGYQTLRESLVNIISAPFRSLRRRPAPAPAQNNYIWALKDLSLEIKQGEAVGIIGRNGAGKTTLLKILCRITTPTEGYAEIHGRVGSLLEVGTGFHPELTGRENIFLNGAVLGMKKKEIERKFADIVEFSGVEKFIDTPLKRYSSGMQVRLAFSVAAHLEPEILLVDEVLAVGDAEFQRKCLGKMGDVTRGGRTVLFVSHNMSAIRKLCPTAILLEKGEAVMRGEANQVIDYYLSSSKTSALSQQVNDIKDHVYPRDSSKPMQIRRVRILDYNGAPVDKVDNRYPFTTEIEFEVNEAKRGDRSLWWGLYSADGETVCGSYSDDLNPERAIATKPGFYLARLEFPGDILNAGMYRLGLETRFQDSVADRRDITFFVTNMQSFGLDSMGRTMGGQRKAILLIPIPWEIEMLKPGKEHSSDE
jgi:lipopolysaccharide transport system ATP-binding protein